jgi:uncharacterized protein (TIGR03435 family)
MSADKYEVAALMPAGATRTQAPEMLRTLLEERFHLVLHREKKPMAVYALVEAKGGAKLTPAAGTRGLWVGNTAGHVGARTAPLPAFAEALSRAVDRPVVDGTGIQGNFDLELTFAPEVSAESGPTLATALQEQLGLRLEKREMAVGILIVDRADRVPVEN